MPKVIGIENSKLGGETTLEKKKQHWHRRQRDRITFLVLGDSLDDTRWDIEATPGIPIIGEPYLGGICKSVRSDEISRVVNPNTGVPCGLWSVDAEWDNSIDDDDKEPTDRTPKVSWSSESENEVLYTDIFGVNLVTGCGEPLFHELPVVLPVLTVTRYEHYPFDPDVILNNVNHVNSAPFYGAPLGCAFMKDISTEEEVIEKIKYVKASYQIKFKLKRGVGGNFEEHGWAAKLLHQGHKFRDTDGKVKVWQDANGQPATVNLWYQNGIGQAGGQLLPEGQDYEYLVFYGFGETDFNNLALGPY
jgi:hypothetical protein